MLSNLANVYRQFDEIPKALSNFQAARAIIEDIGEKDGLARILMNISGIYEDTGDHQRQLEYSIEGLEINERTNDAAYHARILGNVSSAYVGLENFTSALTFIERAIEESERLAIASLVRGQKLVRATILMKHGRLDECGAC